MTVSSRLLLRLALRVPVVTMALVISFMLPPPAHADAAAIAIVSPTFTVSGSFDVTASITQGSRLITNVLFEITGHGEGHLVQGVAVDPATCATTCSVTAHFGSDGSIDAQQIVDAYVGNTPGFPELGDGEAVVSATASDAYGQLAATNSQIDVNNHRPTFAAPALTYDPVTNPSPVLQGTPGALAVDVQGTPNAESGQPITSYKLFIVEDFRPDRVTTLTAPAPATGQTSITFADRGVTANDSGYFAALLAVDASGEQSMVMEGFGVSVAAPYTLSVSFPSPYTDETVATVTPHWFDGSGPSDAWISSFSAVREGVTIGSFTEMTGTHGTFDVTLAAPGGDKLDRGEWNIAIEAVDNFGVRWDMLVGPHITDPITVAWPSTPLVAGTASPVEATVSDASVSPISRVDLTIDGQVIPQPDVVGSPNQVELRAPAATYITGSHSLEVNTTLADGRSYDVKGVLTVQNPAPPITPPTTGTGPATGTPGCAHISRWGSKSGQVRVGGTVTMSRPKCTAPGAGLSPDVSYQWFASGKRIAGARKPTYKIGKALKGKRLTVVITLVVAGGPPQSKAFSFGTVHA